MQIIRNQNAKTETNNGNSFIRRKLRAVITLSKGEFKTGSNAIQIDDLAMSAKVEKLGPPDFGKASIEIFGLRQEIMEQLSTLNMHPLFIKKNYLNIFASDDTGNYSQIFAGSIVSAIADFNSQPDIKFKIDARIGFYGSVTPQGQSVVNGEQKASDFIAKQCTNQGVSFTNQDVNTTVKNTVFSGSPIEQMRQCANEIGAELVIDDDNVILMQSGASRKEGTVPLLSAESGLLGYPTMTQDGIQCKAIFNPNFKFAGLIEIKSLVPKVSGQWRITKLSHSLSSNMPNGGDWTSSITAFYPHMSGATGRFM